jgi:Tfp pilus assembly protein PilF
VVGLWLAASAAGCAIFPEGPARTTTRIVDGRVIAGPVVIPGAYQHYLQARLYQLEGRLREATHELELASDLDPRSWDMHTQLAELYARQARFDDARRQVATALKLEPTSADAHALLGRLNLGAGLVELAEKSFLEAIRHDPAHLESYLRLADLAHRRRDRVARERWLRQLVTRVPQRAIGHLRLGSALLESGALTESSLHLGRAVELAPDSLEAWLRLAEARTRLRRWDEAIHAYREAVELAPDNLELRENLVELQLSRGQLRQALRTVETMATRLEAKTQRKRDEAEGRMRLAELYIRLSRPVEAEHQAQAAQALLPTSVRPQLLLARVAMGKGDHGRARGLLEAVRPGSAHYVEARILLAELHLMLRDASSAHTTLLSALEKRPEAVALYQGLADVYQRTGRLAAAVELLERGLQRMPKNEPLRLSLASAYERIGKIEKGIGQMRTVLAMNPENATALNYVAFLYAERGEHLAEAEQMARRALRQRPDSGAVHDTLGWVLFKQGRYAEAQRALEEAVSLVPREATILDHLGDVYAINRQRDRALTLYRRALLCQPGDPLAQKLREKIQRLNGRADRGERAQAPQ